MRAINFDVLWLNGMPRSGTSWLGQIFDSSPEVRYRLAPLFSYAFKNFVDKFSSGSEWNEFFSQVYDHPGDQFLQQSERRSNNQYPVFIEKNAHPKFLVMKHTRYHNLTLSLLEKVESIKIIHIIRNPCAAISSWLSAPKEFPENANPLDEWRSGACRKNSVEEFWGYDDWKSLTKMYLSLQEIYPNNIYIVRYEDLIDNLFNMVEEMFSFVGMDITDQTREYLEACHSRHEENAYAVYKDKSVKYKWKNQLEKSIQDEIFKDLAGSNLGKFLND